MKRLILATLIVMGAFMTTVTAQTWNDSIRDRDMNRDRDRDRDTVQTSDHKEFMRKAAESGLAEVQMGKLAQSKGYSQSVKNYGSMMERDHSKANQTLQTLAGKKSYTLPKRTSDSMQQTYDRLSKKTGEDFDKAFIDQMVKDHRDVIDLFEKEIKNGNDPEIKTWATQILPTLKQHLQHALDIQQELNRAKKK